MRRHAKALVAVLALFVIGGAGQAIADTAPTPTMEPVSSISYTSAHLSGKVNPNGGPSTTTWQFQYSSEGPAGPWVPGPEGQFEGAEAEETSPLPVAGDLSGLKPNTTYHARLVATNEGGQSSVSAPSFTTLEVASPSVTIEPVSSSTSSTAQFVGHINPNAPEAAPTSPEVEAGFRVSWRFQCTPACPGAEGQLEADNAEHEVSAEATGLKPGTKYKVSLVAENAGTSSSAGPEEFVTEPNAPTIGAISFSDVSTSGATLKATIDPAGAETGYRFEYTDQADFEANGFANATKVPAPDASLGSAPGPVTVSQTVTGLDPATRYAFRVLASNTVDSAASEAKAFKTFALSSEGHRGQFPGRGFLPHDRAWEMVSPPDKNGGNVAAVTFLTRSAAAGDAIAFSSSVSFGDARGTTLTSEYLSRRDGRAGTNGWSTHAITPRQSPITLQQGGTSTQAEAVAAYQGDFSADLSQGVFRSVRPLTEAPNAADVSNLYLRTDLTSPGAGSYRLLTDSVAPPPPLPPAFLTFFASPHLAGASADFSHVLFESPLGLTEGTSFGFNESKLYENVEGTVRLVGRVPAEPATSCDDAGAPSLECVNAPSASAGIPASGYASRMISADGSRIFFQTPPDSNLGGKIFLREDGVRTFQLNASEKDPPESPGNAMISDASRDGSRAFFITGEGLVEGDEENASSDLYMYEVDRPEGERLTRLSVDGVGAARVVGASDDGHYVYFIESIGRLYLWHDGDISLIGRFSSNAPLSTSELGFNDTRAGRLFLRQTKASRITPDGRQLLFTALDDTRFQGNGGLVDYDHGSPCGPADITGCHREVYTYNADSGQLRCASCNPSGAAPTADAQTDVKADPLLITLTSHLSHALSDDGRYVFFSSTGRLVASDTNGTWDAYVYDTTTEEVRLLSSGEDPEPSYFMDASADGRDAFIATAERLSRWDTDASYDLYDARIDGGLPEPAPVPPSCQGDACQPAATQLNDPTPASSSFHGARDPRSRRCPQGKRKVKARGGKTRCVRRRANNNRRQHKRTAKNDRRAGR